ncbi:MAG: TIGR02530 family flagellar biosynthesis protein [Pseudobdellovibrionaceae bacterium]|jgi:flagellar operon protein
MDLKKIQGFENIIQGGGISPIGNDKSKLNPTGPGSFQETLQNELSKAAPMAASPAQVNSLKFSNHAVDRMTSRGVFFNQTELNQINEAVKRAAAKGSKDSLILTDKAALIVSVKNNTVVTVMDKAALKENVFTNIDSTIVM